MKLFASLPPWPFGELIPHHYNLIVADPNWEYEHYSERGIAKGAAAQYDCLPPEVIAEQFPVGELADVNCLLLLWSTWPLLDRQIDCLKRWGFAYTSTIVWHKVFASGSNAVGTGYRVRSMCEPVLLGVKGEPRHKAFPGLFPGIRREHSRKPEAFYDLVADRCPRLKRRADLFSRQTREGWDGWGDEATKFDSYTIHAAQASISEGPQHG